MIEYTPIGIFLKKMNEPSNSNFSDIGIRLIKGFNLPFIFDGTNAMRTFRNIENNFFLIGGCTNKI
jgi:hypothetical protein